VAGQERDPVERVRKLLVAHGYEASSIKAIEKAVKKEVDTAVEESKVIVGPIHDVCLGLLWKPHLLQLAHTPKASAGSADPQCCIMLCVAAFFMALPTHLTANDTKYCPTLIPLRFCCWVLTSADLQQCPATLQRLSALRQIQPC
jgi:hypothetical protein